MYPLMFATPDLERRFRRTCNSSEEIGGYLFVSLNTVKPHDRRVLKPLLHLTDCIGFIMHWLIVPNESSKPETSWTTSLYYPALRNTVQATGNSTGCYYTLHFHTHPDEHYPVPSQNDLAFWLEHAIWFDGVREKEAEGVIANHQGDLTTFRLTLNKATDRCVLARTYSYSWNDRRLREYRKERFGR